MQFNLNNGTYVPYREPGNTLVYIDKKFNHSAVVLKELPKSMAKRTSGILFNYFSSSILPTYSEAFRKSGFNDSLAYTPEATDCNTSERYLV